jgi:hypothetical protein
VRMPVKGREGLVDVDSRRAPGSCPRAVRRDVNPEDYDLVALAMQEPQYRSPACARGPRPHRQGARSVHVNHEHAAVAVPCAHPRLDAQALRDCYTDRRCGTASIPRS